MRADRLIAATTVMGILLCGAVSAQQGSGGPQSRPARQVRIDRGTGMARLGAMGLQTDWAAMAERIGLAGEARETFVATMNDLQEARIKLITKEREANNKIQTLLTPTQMDQYRQEMRKEQERASRRAQLMRPEALKQGLDAMNSLTPEQRATIDALVKRFREDAQAGRGEGDGMGRFEKMQKLITDVMAVLTDEQKDELLQKTAGAASRPAQDRPQRPNRERTGRGPRGASRAQ